MEYQKNAILTLLKTGVPMTKREIVERLYGSGLSPDCINESLNSLLASRQILRLHGKKIKYEFFRDKPSSSSEFLVNTSNISSSGITELDLEKAHKQTFFDEEFVRHLTLLQRTLGNPNFQKNVDRNIVAMKITLIDVAADTHLSDYANGISIDDLSDYIVTQIPDFDQRVAVGDDSLVEQLASFSHTYSMFSFATMYCQYHNMLIYESDDYAVFDTIVQRRLPIYLQRANICLHNEPIDSYTLAFLSEKQDYKTFNHLVTKLLHNLRTPSKKHYFYCMLRYQAY